LATRAGGKAGGARPPVGGAGGCPRWAAPQPPAADPITRAFEAGRDDVTPVVAADTVAQAIAVGAPQLGWRCLDAVRRTGGAAASATDAELPAGRGRAGER